MSRFVCRCVALLSLLTAACGGGAESTPTPSPDAASSTPASSRDACALITAEEAGKILGSPATATARSVSAEHSVCDYVTQAFESFTLEATWRGAEQAIGDARRSANVASIAIGGKDQIVGEVMGLSRVENLGDEAYFSRRAMAYVRKGDVLLGFQNTGLNEPAREHWEALVRAALARL